MANDSFREGGGWVMIERSQEKIKRLEENSWIFLKEGSSDGASGPSIASGTVIAVNIHDP
jgi:hypothetical protein